MTVTQGVEKNGESRPLASEQLWSVLDFARRYRLEKWEENRLLALYGPFASSRDLLANAQRRSLIPSSSNPRHGGSHEA
ncbi:hypothetical protein LJR030_003742 [Rhizobium sp. LjRoot30]|uniref:hypothetical protein n=1 Tax=Rhizobium sp. LjRoot30 TaxID=3342320 RepID=UPI003ECC6D85